MPELNPHKSNWFNLNTSNKSYILYLNNLRLPLRHNRLEFIIWKFKFKEDNIAMTKYPFPVNWHDDPSAHIVAVDVFATIDEHIIDKLHLHYYKKSYPLIVKLHPLSYGTSYYKSTYQIKTDARFSDTFEPADSVMEYVTQIEFVNYKNKNDNKFYCTAVSIIGMKQGRQVISEFSNTSKVTFPKGEMVREKTELYPRNTAITGIELTIDEAEGTVTFINKVYTINLSNSKWSEWSQWSDCDANTGQKTRKRECELGICDGENIEYLSCSQDGYFTDWSEWSDCFLQNIKCGEGSQKRTRKYMPPLYNGKHLEGQTEETRKCSTPCPEATTQELQTMTKTLQTEQSSQSIQSSQSNQSSQTSQTTQSSQSNQTDITSKEKEQKISIPWWVFILILVLIVVTLIILKVKSKKINSPSLNT